MSNITIEPLPAEEILIVYPLVRDAMPSVGVDSWVRFARQQINPRQTRVPRGIRVATFEGERFPSGLYCYHMESERLTPETMVADLFLAVDLLDPRLIFDRLIADLDVMASQLGCTEIRSVLHYHSTLAAQRLFAAGYHPQGMVFRKTVAREFQPMPPVALT